MLRVHSHSNDKLLIDLKFLCYRQSYRHLLRLAVSLCKSLTHPLYDFRIHPARASCQLKRFGKCPCLDATPNGGFA